MAIRYFAACSGGNNNVHIDYRWGGGRSADYRPAQFSGIAQNAGYALSCCAQGMPPVLCSGAYYASLIGERYHCDGK